MLRISMENKQINRLMRLCTKKTSVSSSFLHVCEAIEGKSGKRIWKQISADGFQPLQFRPADQQDVLIWNPIIRCAGISSYGSKS